MVNNILYIKKANQAIIGQYNSSFVGSDIPCTKVYIIHYKVYNCAHTPTALIKNCNESPPH